MSASCLCDRWLLGECQLLVRPPTLLLLAINAGLLLSQEFMLPCGTHPACCAPTARARPPTPTHPRHFVPAGCSLAHWEQARAGPEEQAERQALVGVLAREAQMCEELLEVEPEAKWPLLTLVRLRELQRTLALSTASGAGGGEARGAAASGAAGAAGAWGAAAADAGSEGSDEVAELYARLEMIDPLRRGYYGDAKSGRAHVVAAVLAPAGGGS